MIDNYYNGQPDTETSCLYKFMEMYDAFEGEQSFFVLKKLTSNLIGIASNCPNFETVKLAFFFPSGSSSESERATSIVSRGD